MAVEKMYMLSLIGKQEDLESVLTDILCSGRISLTNALNQIEQEGLTMEIPNDELYKKVDFNYVTTVSKDEDMDELLRKAKKLQEVMRIDLDDDIQNYCGILNARDINEIYGELEQDIDRIHAMRERLAELDAIEENYRLVLGLDVNIEELRDMEYFDFSFGRLSPENKAKMRSHDDKLLASMFQVQAGDGNDVFLSIFPKRVSQETDRILRSLNWKEIKLDPGYSGSIEEILAEIQAQRDELSRELAEEEKAFAAQTGGESQKYRMLISAVQTKEITENLKALVASGSRYFYITGWVPESDKDLVSKMFAGYDDLLVSLTGDEEMPGLRPPTKLKNNRIFRPFEMLVNMYGTPNYREIDPTSYFGITYMLLFAMMFGDVGQGLVIALAGWLLARKGSETFGGLLIRIGLASTVFGFLYGSVFSIETILPPLLISPFHNINTVLLAAVGFGIILSTSAYILGIINAWRRRDIEEGLFGKEGVAGLILFWSFVLIVLSFVDINTLPRPVLIGLILLSILAMLFREPLTHMIQGRRPLHSQSAGSYYMENSFALIETLLAVLSGVVSFIRVGAFAINHAGLFLAFETLGHMIGTSGGMIAMTILGNILIIGLEGLIVFIQGLRLEFYELFSKYYTGDGVAFKPVTTKK